MIHLVSFSAVTWNFPLVGRTRMLSEAWQQLGQPTTFVQVPYVRTAMEKLCPWGRPAESVRVVRPWPAAPRRLWPLLGAQRVNAWSARRARAVRRQLDGLLDWDRAAALVVSPVWAPWLDSLPFRAVVYDCIDEPSVHVPRASLHDMYMRWEAELVARADGAIVTAEQLATDLRRRRPDLPQLMVRNGVDAERFAALAARDPQPTDLPTERPIVGFVGAMYDWLAWDLMAETIRAVPELDFVFVGPHDGRGAVEKIAGLPNVHLLGRRPYERVPAYVRAFDVCWVPFQPGDVATAANPVKIYEYLALGKPVVTTPVADTDTFGDLLHVARTPAELAAALRSAATTPANDAATRIAFAQANSWPARARAIADFVEHLVTGEHT
ncbi:MAG: glycosyltransferase [Phycisphaerae bacterium]|jgi:glycosyltransferase involved in cell wall biosynthesis